MVVFLKNPIQALLCFIFGVINIIAIFIFFEADFIALIFFLVYVGAIAVLFLALIMFLNLSYLFYTEINLNYYKKLSNLFYIFLFILLGIIYINEIFIISINLPINSYTFIHNLGINNLAYIMYSKFSILIIFSGFLLFLTTVLTLIYTTLPRYYNLDILLSMKERENRFTQLLNLEFQNKKNSRDQAIELFLFNFKKTFKMLKKKKRIKILLTLGIPITTSEYLLKQTEISYFPFLQEMENFPFNPISFAHVKKDYFKNFIKTLFNIRIYSPTMKVFYNPYISHYSNIFVLHLKKFSNIFKKNLNQNDIICKQFNCLFFEHNFMLNYLFFIFLIMRPRNFHSILDNLIESKCLKYFSKKKYDRYHNLFRRKLIGKYNEHFVFRYTRNYNLRLKI
jgi:NADH:ubiquinone oxidoreductase subunit 6 (subunit J)